MKGEENETNIDVSKIFGGGVKLDTLPLSKVNQNKSKNRITKIEFVQKCKTVLLFVLFALIWNSIPVTASVTDNLRSTAAGILGTVDASVKNSYENAPTNAKINYLEEEIQELKELVAYLETVIETADIK